MGETGERQAKTLLEESLEHRLELALTERDGLIELLDKEGAKRALVKADLLTALSDVKRWKFAHTAAMNRFAMSEQSRTDEARHHDEHHAKEERLTTERDTALSEVERLTKERDELKEKLGDVRELFDQIQANHKSSDAIMADILADATKERDALRSSLTALYTALGVTSQEEAVAKVGELREYTGEDAT